MSAKKPTPPPIEACPNCLTGMEPHQTSCSHCGWVKPTSPPPPPRRTTNHGGPGGGAIPYRNEPDRMTKSRQPGAVSIPVEDVVGKLSDEDLRKLGLQRIPADQR